MSGFVAGFLAGVCMFKVYEANTKEETERTKGNDNCRTASRATELNRASLKNFYNETADDTSGATHVNFLSDVVARLWPYLNKAGAELIRQCMEPTFKEILPGPLSSLKFKKLELGDVPFIVDNILVRELRTIDDEGQASGENKQYMQFEWDVTWRSDCDIQLATDKIAGMAAIVFGIKTVTLSGRLQVIAKPLSTVFPCMDAVQFAFVNPPKVELDFTGLANVADFNLKVAGVSVMDIRGMVRGIVDDILGQSMVLPNRCVAPLVDNLEYWNAYCPPYKGLARIRLHSGRGFQIQKASTPFGKDDIPDVYVKIRLGVEKFFTSNVCKDDCNPKWDSDEEFHDFLFCSGRDQIFEIQAWDRDSGALDKDDFLGIAFVTIGQVLLEADRHGRFEIELMTKATNKNNPRSTGNYITISLEKLPFSTKDLSSMSPMEINKNFSKRDVSRMSNKERKLQIRKDEARVVGLATIVISHAVNLPFAKAEGANTFVKVFSGSGPDRKELGVTPTVPDSLCPHYMMALSIPLTVADTRESLKSPGNQNFSFEVFHQNPKKENAKPELLGIIVVEHDQIKVGDECSLRDRRPIGTHLHSTLAFTVSFAGVQTAPGKKILQNDTTNANSGVGIPESSLISHSNKLISTVESNLGDLSVGDESIEIFHENKIRIRIVKGWGFRTEKKGRFQKSDIPDVYCMIKFGSRPTTWRTPTIKDCESPEWEDEFRDYTMESMNEVISVDVWDENRKGEDDYYGNARTTIAKVLLNNGTLDIEVRDDSRSNTDRDRSLVKPIFRAKRRADKASIYIRVQCQKM